MDDFYQRLPEGQGFAAAFDDALYRPVPRDWIVATTDVVGATAAIAAGRYKDVTIAGALGTVALANHLGSLEFPFFFGGDGMMFLLPPEHLAAASVLLDETRELVQRISGLELRVAVFPVGTLYRLGASMEIARVRVSPTYVQAVGRGDAFALAERILKGELSTDSGIEDDTGVRSSVVSAGKGHDGVSAGVRLAADYSGFSCRWRDIPSHRGETLSLIIECPAGSGASSEGWGNLETIQARIRSQLGDPDHAHPLSISLQTTRAFHRGAEVEALVHTNGRRALSYRLQRLNIAMQVWIVRMAIFLQLPLWAMGKELRRVREDNIQNSDVQKLDGTLKMVLAVTPDERQRIIRDLEQQQIAGAMCFGYHVADRAIMTCLLRLDQGFEVHFVDAADGGYAMAARMLKDQQRQQRGVAGHRPSG